MSLIDNLKWRYATKRMSGEKVSEEKMNFILDALQLSASSFGLQPYTVLVISNPEIKIKLRAAAYDQPQLSECSHVLVFCPWERITSKDVSDFIQSVAAKRGMTADSLKGFQDAVQGSVDTKTEAEQQVWSAKQAYIALGTALAAAAEIKVDACPMEGFSPAQFSEILGLKEKGLVAAAIISLGFRSTEDGYANAPKYRREKNKLFQLVE